MKTTAGGQTADASVDRADRDREGVKLLRLFAALVLVNGLLLGPDYVLLRGEGAAWLALEACVLVAVFALLPRTRSTAVVAAAAAVTVLVVFVLEIAETTTWLSLSRPLNLYMDVWLADSVHHLLVGALGTVPAVVAEIFGLLALIGLGAGVAFLLIPTRGEARGFFPRVGVVAGLVFVTVGFSLDRVERLDARVDVPVVRLVRDQATRLSRALGERERFEADLARATDSYAGLPGLLDGLGGRDVILAFVESYGVSAIEDPRYAPVVGPRLDDLERRMAAAGLHVVSGRLVAPSQGGQSWFGHGSMLSGLWLDNQIRYDMMLSTGRETLIDDFERAGYRTAALMPAIRMAWPEGSRFGYEEIFAFGNIDYAGPPLNWVTMPDQFTWSFLQNTIRPRDPSRPLFTEIGLISSHAPWTPILPVLDDWDSIGDGSVFAAWENAGEPPRELWRDSDRVREHYALSVEYAVHAMTSYAERYVDEGTLLIVLGDHQPAPLVTGEGASWEVPVHVISGDAAVLKPFLEWGFASGAWPGEGETTVGMDYFRDWFVRAYSGADDG
jgi:hypothetical protein